MTTGFCILFLLGAPPPADCTCKAAKLSNHWCHACAVGYVAGITIKSALLYEVLDPHGHDIDLERIRCASCKLAVKEDGYCRRCGMGFVRGQAYMSRLTYHLAKGRPIASDKIECAACAVDLPGNSAHRGHHISAPRDWIDNGGDTFAHPEPRKPSRSSRAMAVFS